MINNIYKIGSLKLDTRHWSLRFLVLLLITDCIFFGLHFLFKYHDLFPFTADIAVFNSPNRTNFLISKDGGYAEIFQYLKEFWIALLFAWSCVQKRSPLYICWSLLFLYLLLDDACRLHENLGRILSEEMDLLPAFKLRAKDLGELIVSGFFGSLFLISIGVSYQYSNSADRQIFRQLIGLLTALALCGIVADIVQRIFTDSFLGSIWSLIEDGGEHIVMSIITCFVLWFSDCNARNASILRPERENKIKA